MKILEVITSLLTGGAEHLIVQIVEKMVSSNITIDVCLFDGEDTPLLRKLQTSSCKIYSFSNTKSFYNPFFIFKLRKIISDYDIIHTHNSSPQLFTAIANLGMGKILVTTEHNTFNRKRDNIFLSILDRWMYKQYNKIICISDKTRENLIDYLRSNNLQKDNFVTIVNGVDLSSFNIFKNIQEPYTNNKTIVTMVGAFRPQKDQKTLIDAWKYLPRETFQLWLIGDGELFQPTYAYAQKSVARNEIFFWGNREDVSHLLMSSHIVVLSSHWEGFGLAIVEGMASRKPVIASDVDGLREVTQGAGILFPQGDAKALAKAIRLLHDDPTFYRDVAERCYARAQQYDIQKMVDGYEQVYLSLINECNV